MASRSEQSASAQLPSSSSTVVFTVNSPAESVLSPNPPARRRYSAKRARFTGEKVTRRPGSSSERTAPVRSESNGPSGQLDRKHPAPGRSGRQTRRIGVDGEGADVGVDEARRVDSGPGGSAVDALRDAVEMPGEETPVG